MSNLKEITEKLFQYKNIEYEKSEDSIEALLPRELQLEWEVPEFVSLNFSEKFSDKQINIHIDSEWPEKFLNFLHTEGTHGFYIPELQVSPKAPDAEKIIAKELILHNSIYKIKNIEQQFSIYSTFIIKAIASSDEKREAIFPLSINESNLLLSPELGKAVLDPINTVESLPYSNFKKEARNISEILEPVEFLIRASCYETFSSFIHGMDRRMNRDYERIYSYYTDMQNQIIEKVAGKLKKDLSYDCGLEKQRISSIEKEYLSKVTDIKRKYKISLEYEVIQWLRTRIPVYRIEILLQRRKNSRKIFVDYNSLIRKPDSIHCEFCGKITNTFEIEDNTLKLKGICCIS